jgi:hypothetical protein
MHPITANPTVSGATYAFGFSIHSIVGMDQSIRISASRLWQTFTTLSRIFRRDARGNSSFNGHFQVLDIAEDSYSATVEAISLKFEITNDVTIFERIQTAVFLNATQWPAPT